MRVISTIKFLNIMKTDSTIYDIHIKKFNSISLESGPASNPPYASPTSLSAAFITLLKLLRDRSVKKIIILE